MVSSHLSKAGSNQTEHNNKPNDEKGREKQSTKQAAIQAEEPRKSDFLWILLEFKEYLGWLLPLWLGFLGPSSDMDSLELIKRWTYSVVCSSADAIRSLYSLSSCCFFYKILWDCYFSGLAKTDQQLTFDQTHTKAMWSVFLGNEIKNKCSE